VDALLDDDERLAFFVTHAGGRTPDGAAGAARAIVAAHR
jgi:hypothetical protein